MALRILWKRTPKSTPGIEPDGDFRRQPACKRETQKKLLNICLNGDEIKTDNWLDSKEIECAQCGQKLHWLWHSPMDDEMFFYCTHCPMPVEICHYDDPAMKLRQIAGKRMGERATTEFSRLYIGLIEQNLMPCDCGGTFTYAAARRCLRCFAILPQSEPGRDVYPPESPDEAFSPGYQSLSLPTRSLIKTENVWKVRS